MNLDYFRAKLRIDKHRLDDDLVEQGEVLEHIGRQLSIARRQAAEAKDELEWVRSRLIRYHKRSGIKMTAGEIESLVVEDPDRLQAFKCLMEAEQSLNAWESMYDAWKSRGFALREIAALVIAGYYASNSAGPDAGYKGSVRGSSNGRGSRSRHNEKE